MKDIRRKELEGGRERIRKIKQHIRKEIREKPREMWKNDDKDKTREKRRNKEIRGMGEKWEEKTLWDWKYFHMFTFFCSVFIISCPFWGHCECVIIQVCEKFMHTGIFMLSLKILLIKIFTDNNNEVCHSITNDQFMWNVSEMLDVSFFFWQRFSFKDSCVRL